MLGQIFLMFYTYYLDPEFFRSRSRHFQLKKKRGAAPGGSGSAILRKIYNFFFE